MRRTRTTNGVPTAGRRPTVRIVATQDRHAEAVAHVVRRAHGMDMGEPCASCPSPGHVRRQIRRFPEGQFVAVIDREDGSEQVVGAATLMRTDDPPGARPKSWMRMVGGLSLRHHVQGGRWLYGVEMAVDPDWQGRGVGSALYRRRLALVRELGLAGMYAGGQLKGYRRYRRRMTPREYAERVRRGEIDDPTVTMQLRRGFRAAGVIEDYEEDEDSGNCAMLIVWRPPRRPRGPAEARQAPPARGG